MVQPGPKGSKRWKFGILHDAGFKKKEITINQKKALSRHRRYAMSKALSNISSITNMSKLEVEGLHHYIYLVSAAIVTQQKLE
jgi:hypothetical protein